MKAEHPHPRAVGKHHPLAMRESRGVIDIETGHAMAATSVAPGGRAAGHKNARFRNAAILRNRNRVAELSVFEGGRAERRDIGERFHAVGTYALTQAKFSIRSDGVELMAKNLKRKRLKVLSLGHPDEGQNSVVNRHPGLPGRQPLDMMASREARIQSCSAI